MPTFTKVKEFTTQKKTTGKRGRPIGSKTEKEKIYVFAATCKKGCAGMSSGIRTAEIACKHGNVMQYVKMVLK